MVTGSGDFSSTSCRHVQSSHQTPHLCLHRLSRVSADSHREPMLPCILEGLPSQDSEVTMACPPALDELLGRSSRSCKLQHGDSAAYVSAKVAAVWPQSLLKPPFQLPLSDGSLKGSATVLRGSPESPKGSPTSVIGSSSSVKGTAPNGKPPVSPKSKSASARSDVAICHCYCSDIQSFIRSQHFPPSQYIAGIAALPSLQPCSFVLCQLGFVTQSIHLSSASRLCNSAFCSCSLSLFCC